MAPATLPRPGLLPIVVVENCWIHVEIDLWFSFQYWIMFRGEYREKWILNDTLQIKLAFMYVESSLYTDVCVTAGLERIQLLWCCTQWLWERQVYYMGVATFAALSSDVDMPTTGIEDSLLTISLCCCCRLPKVNESQRWSNFGWRFCA